MGIGIGIGMTSIFKDQSFKSTNSSLYHLKNLDLKVKDYSRCTNSFTT